MRLALMGVFSAMCLASVAEAAPTLQSGLYLVNAVSFTCLLTNTSGYLSYAGAGNTGSVLSLVSSDEYSTQQDEYIDNSSDTYLLPSVPTDGPANWSGSYTDTNYYQLSDFVYGNSPPQQSKTTGLITLQLTAVNVYTFAGTLTITPKGGSACQVLITGAKK